MSSEVTGGDPRARAVVVKGPSVNNTNNWSRPHGEDMCGGVGGGGASALDRSR